MERQHKQFMPIEVKFPDDVEGTFVATFSRFNVIDKDGDVTLPGAFKDGQAVRIAQWGHNWGALPVGKGTINSDDEKAWVSGEFFLDTTAGRETYTVVKNLGELQEWSYGFEVTEHSYGEHDGQRVQFLRSLDVFEVSPVMIGAGVGTGTEVIKSATADSVEYAGLWVDGERFPLMRVATQRMTDEKGVDHVFIPSLPPAYFQLTKQEPDDDTTDDIEEKGYANGGRIQTSSYLENETGCALVIPHDAKDDNDDILTKRGRPLQAHREAVLDAATDLVSRYEALVSSDAKEGRTISSARRQQMATIVETLEESAAKFRGILADTEPEQDEDHSEQEARRQEERRKHAEFMAREAGIELDGDDNE